MKKFIEYFIQYPVVANLVMILIIVFGFFGLKSLQTTFFPERASNTIKIDVTYPGSSPEEIEEGIVLKIEDNLESVTGIDRVSSVSQENSGSITIEVLESYNTDLILQDVKNAVDRISSFPDAMEPPEVYKRERLDFAISFALSGPVRLKTLKEEAQRIEDQLQDVDGISKVELSGFPPEEIEVAVKEEQLRAYGLTFDQIARKVRNANLEITGGRIEGKQEEMLIRAMSKEYYAREFKSIVVKSGDNGQVVRLSDVATVRDQWSDDPNRTYLNQNRAVVITIQSTIHEDILWTTDYIQDFIKNYNKENEIIQAKVIRNRADSLRGRVNILSENGSLGFLLVITLLSLFLHPRLAFWVAIAIPISFLGMFICASFYDLTINQISLFGMILVIGILVDDGIVIAENIYQKWEEGQKPLKAAVNGTMEVLPPVTGAILTTVAAFSTFFFMTGTIGDFMSDMAFVVTFTLIFSLVEGAIILPAHIGHSKALHERNVKKNIVNRHTEKFMDWMKFKLYKPVLDFTLHNKVFSLGIAFGTLFFTFGALNAGIIKTTFFPNIERESIEVSLEMPSGTQDHITAKWLNHIKSAAQEVNDSLSGKREDGRKMIKDFQKTIGPTTNKGELKLILMDSEHRNLPSFAITNMVREKAGKIPGAENVDYGMSSPFGKPISVSLLSENLEQLEMAKSELKAELEQLTSVKDVSDNDQPGLREVRIKLKEKAHLLGLDLRSVMAQVRNGFFGNEVQRLQRGLDEVKVWVRYGKAGRESLGQLERMRIRVEGNEYPLRELAHFSIERGTLAINHLNGNREVTVNGDLSNPSLSATDIMEAIREDILPPIQTKYPSVKVSYEGQSRESSKTQRSAGQIIPVILLLMIAIVTFIFRSFSQALVVFLVLPFGLIGVGWGHVIHGNPISLLSNHGIIALVGIMVNDALVLINRMNNLLKKGEPFMKALQDASVSRFRPILLTSLTTVAGLGPLILEQSFQAQFLIPMAISVAYGMIAATVVTLVILPVFLVIQNQAKVYLKWLWTGEKPAMEAVEPGEPELIEE